MASAPTDGGSPGTWGAENNAWVGTTLDTATGKVKNEALQVADTAPIADAALANKKYVDDLSQTSPAAYIGGQSMDFANGLQFRHGFQSGTGTKTISYADFDNACISFTITDKDNAGGSGTINSNVISLSAASASIWINTNSSGAYWQAWGY